MQAAGQNIWIGGLKYKEDGEKYIMWSFIICTLRQRRYWKDGKKDDVRLSM
jgi:hypothetical protein